MKKSSPDPVRHTLMTGSPSHRLWMNDDGGHKTLLYVKKYQSLSIVRKLVTVAYLFLVMTCSRVLKV